MRWSIAVRLTIAMWVSIVVLFSLVVHRITVTTGREVTCITRENMRGVARGVAGEISQSLAGSRNICATLANESEVIEFLAAPPDERKRLAEPTYRTLRNFCERQPQYDNLFLLDRSGKVVAATAATLLDDDWSNKDYFAASMEGRAYISSLTVSPELGRPGVFVTCPVKTPAGHITGVSVIWLKPDAIWSPIDGTQIGAKGVAYVVDDDGVIVAHPDRKLLYHSLMALPPSARDIICSTRRFGYAGGAPLVPEPLGMEELAAELMSRPDMGTCIVTSPLDGERHVVAYARMQHVPMTVIVDVPESQFMAPARRATQAAWNGMILAALFALVLGTWAIVRITLPICRLTRAVQAIEAGHRIEPADVSSMVRGSDEVARIGHAMADMIAAVQERQQRTEHLNAVLRAIRAINQFVTHEREPEVLLQRVCETLVETRRYLAAWIAHLNEEGELLTIYEAGVTPGTTSLLHEAAGGSGLSPCMVRALKQPCMLIIEDRPATCGDCPLLAGCVGKAAWTVRLEYGGHLYGVLGITTQEAVPADDEERTLLEEVADDIAFGLFSIQTEAERDEAEQALMESEQMLADIFHGIQDGISFIDREMTIRRVNIWMERMYPDRPLVGRKCYEAYQNRTSVCPWCPSVKAMDTGEMDMEVVPYPTAEAPTGWLELWAYPMVNGKGEVTGVIKYAKDITERVQTQRALQELNEQLERRVQERTAELAAANRELESFAYSVSHDLRAPLRAITGFSRALTEELEEVLDEQGRDYLRRIIDAGERMGQLIDDMLKLSRLTRVEMERENVDLTALAREVDDELRRLQPDRDVQFTAQEGITGYGDRVLLQAVLTNLLENAWKFTEGRPTARVEFGAMEMDGEMVYYVRDNGIGFDMSYADKLFLPFQRLHRVDEFPGTGIGLATVRRIVNRHGGRVWAEGEPDKGATVYFTLQTEERTENKRGE
ncbi:MAG: GAF domain-containing protein [Armatimonadetes bacterium]|nr:GAF domain-containing protein [Armatimonadota bacterium]